MKIVIEISERAYKFIEENGIKDIYGIEEAICNGQILPDNAEILTAKAYSDLCLRASEKSPCALCKWNKVGEDTYCWECNARPIEEGADE